MSNFVHLHVHSQYSILDALPSIEDLAAKAKEFEMPALAITDHGNLFGAVDFYKTCKEIGIKPIIGCEFYEAPENRKEKSRVVGTKNAYHLTLLAKNEEGYRNLCKLSSFGYLEGFYYHPRIDLDLLQQHSKGLICLSGCLNSRLSHEILFGSEKGIREIIQKYRKIFGEDYYLEISRHSMSQSCIEADGLMQEAWLWQQYQDCITKQEKINIKLLELSQEFHIPCAATNDVHYIAREDWPVHETLLNIQSGEPCEIWEKDSYGNPKFRVPNPRRRTYPSHELYFKSPQQMTELFKDIPQALSSTLEIAEKCHFSLDFKSKHYPVYLPPSLEGKSYSQEEQTKEVERFLWKLCEEGIAKRYTKERLNKVEEIFGKDPMQIIRSRLEYEMSIIVPKGMADYLLIVWDFINWAKSNGIPVGPGRGSGAGSIVLYLIGVTDIEPLRFHLFFERFINPERISYPDIDVDICMDKRDEVIAYTLQKYGRDNVAQIITFMTMKAKSSIKDVGRAFSVPLAKVNTIAKLVPEELDMTIEKALEMDAELRNLYQDDQDCRRILDVAKKLEGSIRSTGIHAAGIIISGQPLIQYIPICNAKDSDIPVSQYSMKPVEAVGMLKIDFLGLKTLTAIQQCVQEIQSSSQKSIDWVDLPLDDKPTFDLLNQGKTQGVFQLESGGMQDLAKHLHLDRFEEIIAVGALYRPGPMDMIPSFISRKHGREPIEYDHPWMKDILSETYGIMVYQEQVMQIASKLANYSLGEGDVLRRAMGKKELEQMAKQRDKFRLGSLENSIDEQTSMRIFDKMEKFASYGFNKSHAAAYGYLSYVTAYLKANFPKEWLASLMTCDSDDLTKVAKHIREAKSMNIPILLPDINEAGQTFIATSKGIRFAMSGIRGIGSGVVDAILEERRKKGSFTSIYEFLQRIDTKKVGKKNVESLIDAGAFDFTHWSRDALLYNLDAMFEQAAEEQLEASQGFLSLFSRIEGTKSKPFSAQPEIKKTRSPLEILLREKELLGFFLTGHPMDAYRDILKRLSCIPLRQVEDLPHDTIFRSAVLLESIETRLSAKTQKKFAILQISDGIERYELPIWSEMYEEKSGLLKENQLLYTVLQVDKKEDDMRLICKWFGDLTKANDEMIHACDQAFDKAKQQAFRFSQNKNKGEKKQMPSSETKDNKKLVVKINTDTAKLSHILTLKTHFKEHRGSIPVLIDFLKQGQTIAHLHIDQRWGVKDNQELKNLLKNLESIVSVDFLL